MYIEKILKNVKNTKKILKNVKNTKKILNIRIHSGKMKLIRSR